MNRLISLVVAVGLLAIAGLGTANADPFAKIPVGTVITKANCQQYLDHMTEVLGHECTMNQVQLSMPADYQIVIKPTVSYPVPHSFWDATEKYSKQVTLEPTGDGSYRMKGYVAGMPFPTLDMKDPLAGFKLMYDAYFQYQPAMMSGDGLHTISIDRYGNRSDTLGWIGNYVLSHNSDPAYPMVIPGSPGDKDGVYFASSIEQEFPTQIQYLSGLEWDYSDPDRIPENYAFIPSIRRVLQLSQAARCAPFTASSNFSYDDHSRIQLPPVWFKAQFLGAKQEITYVVPPNRLIEATKESNWDIHYGIWPKDSLGGHWEVRVWYQLATQRLPRYAAGYCEANHYIWLDKEQVMTIAYDDFDQNGKYWRGQYNYNPAKPVPGGGYSFYSGLWAHLNPDVQNVDNSSTFPFVNWWFNQEVPKRFLNLDRYATPGGLNQIVQ
ncbi:MAG TPA: DUF1329 domain-containing protein [Candidatus Binataceae bacterium]|nr:DUF1329 domain-containing protein [Candidatus Binataceae bacterium]